MRSFPVVVTIIVCLFVVLSPSFAQEVVEYTEYVSLEECGGEIYQDGTKSPDNTCLFFSGFPVDNHDLYFSSVIFDCTTQTATFYPLANCNGTAVVQPFEGACLQYSWSYTIGNIRCPHVK